MMLRIAVGGISHETNSFSPVKTTYDDFRIIHGETVLAERLTDFADRADIDFRPLFHAGTMPSGLVERAAYEQMKADLLAGLKSCLPLDGVYLDLHGAMEVAEVGDAEGDLAQAVRTTVGPTALIAVSLDLHGNISPTLVESANILTAYRTAPHRDGPETRQRAVSLLVDALRRGITPRAVLRKVPLLLAGESAVTEREPARSLYAQLPQLAGRPGLLDASLLIGCAWTDSPFTPASVIVVAEDDLAPAQAAAAELARLVWTRRHDFNYGVENATIDEAIRRAMAAPERPVFISDSGDNVTAGGAGDIPHFVDRLLALGAQKALVAGLADSAAVRACAAAGVGAQLELTIGGKLDREHGRPLTIAGRVVRLASEVDAPDGPPTTAVVESGGVSLILAVDRRFFPSRAAIAAAGVEPMAFKIVVVKQGYLFPDLADHAPRAIMALSPGATTLKLETLPYRYLPRPIFPLDGDFAWEP